jgi:hypothetical protein
LLNLVVGVMIHVFLLRLHALHALDFIDMHLVVLMIMQVHILKSILVVVIAHMSILSYYLIAFMHVLVLPIPFDLTMDLVLMCCHLHLWFRRVVLHGFFLVIVISSCLLKIENFSQLLHFPLDPLYFRWFLHELGRCINVYS